VFAAYVPGVGHAVANGGRYDDIGKAYGRARPATGFSANVKSLLSVAPSIENKKRILAPLIADDASLAQTIAALREKGEVVVQALPEMAPENCDYQLLNENGSWQVKPLG
jgi:ATP phosphoribosyltransferase regulatory subunit